MIDGPVRSLGEATALDPAVQARIALVGRVMRWAVMAYCAMVLVSVLTGIYQDTLQQPGPVSWRTISPSLLVGLTLLALGSVSAGENRFLGIDETKWRTVGIVLAFLAATYGVYLCSTVLFDASPPWSGSSLDMPAFSGGLMLVALGLALPLTISRVETRIIAGQVAALLSFSLAGATLVAYALGDPSLGRIIDGPPLSLQAALIILFSAVGVLLIRPGSGILSAASSPGPGGTFLRRFGLFPLIVPAAIVVAAERQAASDRVDALAIAMVSLGLVLLIFTAFVVRTIDRTAVEAATASAQAERAAIGLSQEAPLVADLADLLHLVEIDSSDGLEVVTRFRPAAGSVAGDSTGVRRLPSGEIGIVLIDVTGHGAGPTVQALRSRDFLMTALACSVSPARALWLLNAFMTAESMLSAIVVTLDPDTGQGRLASAGHPPAIRTKIQTGELLGPTGPLVHLSVDPGYETIDLVLEPGEALVVFSDGVADVQRERSGTVEVELLLERLLGEGGDANRTAELVMGFAEPSPSDDQSVVVVRRAG